LIALTAVQTVVGTLDVAQSGVEMTAAQPSTQVRTSPCGISSQRRAIHFGAVGVPAEQERAIRPS
jgi:hypothetical protein